MKKYTKAVILSMTLFVSVIIVGCAGQTVTPAHQDPVTGEQVAAVTNYTPNAVIGQIASGAQMAAPLVPQPWGALIAGLGVLATAISGTVATVLNLKNNQKKTMLQAVITGVEQANNPATKTAIQDVATALGANDKLHQLVQNVTSILPGTK